MQEPDISPNKIAEGRPATVGGPPAYASTAGGPLGGQVGPPHAYPSLRETSYATVENGYAITLEKEDGDRLTIETIIGDFSPAREHSALSDWDAVVPYSPDELEEYTYDTRAWITWNGRVIFAGYCREVSSALMDGESVIAGPGPGTDLDEGVFSLTFTNIQVWRAFRRLFGEITDWSFHVARPPDPIVIDELEVTGTALECIEQLADEYGWHFLVHQSRWHHIEAFEPGHSIGTATWTQLDNEREKDTTDYYNATGVIGNIDDDGTRIIGYYEDNAEIGEHAARRGLTYTQARKIQALDEDIDSWAEANAVAKARTKEAIREADVSGSVETWPTLIEPGKAYPVDEWDGDRKVGPYSLLFDGESYATLPPRVFRGLESEGGVALWARAEWSDLSDAPLLGSEGGPQLVADDGLVAFALAGESVALTDRPLFDSEWVLLHADWTRRDGETVLRGGWNGSLADEETANERPDLEISDLWLGYDGEEYYPGYQDWVQVFGERPVEPHYGDIEAGDDVPAHLVRARYGCNEGPNRSDETLFDSYGGHHGELHGVEYAGSPKVLQQVQFSHGAGTADCTLQFRRDRGTASEVERLKRQLKRRT